MLPTLISLRFIKTKQQVGTCNFKMFKKYTSHKYKIKYCNNELQYFNDYSLFSSNH